MLLTQDKNEFELRLLRIEDESDSDFVWLIADVRVKQGENRFHESGPWLTVNEAKQLTDFFARPIEKEQLACNDFIEPNLGFMYDPSHESLKINLALEAKPKWLDSGSISFFVSVPDRERLAKEIEAELRAILSSHS